MIPPDIDQLVDLVEKILNNDGRLSAGSSHDLDHAWDLVDEWFKKHDTELLRRLENNDQAVEAIAKAWVEDDDNWTWAGLPQDSREGALDRVREFLRALRKASL